MHYRLWRIMPGLSLLDAVTYSVFSSQTIKNASKYCHMSLEGTESPPWQRTSGTQSRTPFHDHVFFSQCGRYCFSWFSSFMVLLLFTLFCWFLFPCLLNVHTSLLSSPLIYPGDHRPSSLLSLRGIANGMCLVNKLLTSASSKCLHVQPSFYHLMQFLLSRLKRYSLV